MSGLPLDQIGHPPTRPQCCPIAQHLWAFFEATGQLLQLVGQQPGLPTGAAGFKQRPGSLDSPRLMPPADRLSVHPQFPGHLALAKTLVEESRCLESPSLQTVKIAFNAFWVAHAQRLTPTLRCVTILRDAQ